MATREKQIEEIAQIMDDYCADNAGSYECDKKGCFKCRAESLYNFKKRTRIFMAVIMLIMFVSFTSCDSEYEATDEEKTMTVTEKLKDNQATPTDINYSLERYNLIRRAYWVNGQREKANALVCQIEKPLGYIVLFQGNTVVSSFVVDGKVSSLNSYLTPDSEYYSSGYTERTKWLADVDGSYGENDSGIFFFTPDGKYVEWTGTYLYSDIPFEVDEPVVKYMED